MLGLGVGPHLGLPAAPDLPEFSRVCGGMAPVLQPQPVTLLTALLSELAVTVEGRDGLGTVHDVWLHGNTLQQ